MRIRLHEQATERTLGYARVYVFLVWLVRLWGEPMADLGYLPPALFHAHGLMALVPSELISAFTDPAVLLLFKYGLMACLAWVILGLRGARAGLWISVGLLCLWWGYSKGLGGHVNHRELILLYVSAGLGILPCLNAVAVHPERRPVGERVCQAGMVLLCSIVAIHYLAIGIARLSIGFPQVFYPMTMEGWLLDRVVRPNPRGFELANLVLSSPLATRLNALTLPVSTALEILFPLVLFFGRRWRLILLASVGLFHVGIYLLMNISFAENVCLLLLFTRFDPGLDRLVRPTSSLGQAALAQLESRLLSPLGRA